jgi:hypothetical protein
MFRKSTSISSRLMIAEFFVVLLTLSFDAFAQTIVQDIFGRTLNEHGITLVDWDGYLANPLIKVIAFAPTNGVLPGTATLTANGSRFYFDKPSVVSSNGPSKTISLITAGVGVPVRLSLFPDRDGLGEDYTLTIVFAGANNAKQTNTVPIHIIDQDIQRTNDFVVTANFDRDLTSFFTNATRRTLVKQAAEDWAYFFANTNLDSVAVGKESTYIWSNNFNGGYYFINTNSYTGYLLYAYGTTNGAHRSGGEGSFAGDVQHSGGSPLTVKRSGGFEAEIYGNYNTLGWLLLTNDADWLATGNLGNETNDFYSIAHHEIGHALAFNPAHPGFNTAKTAGAFTSPAVTNYYGASVPIDPFDHLNGVIDPESGQGAFGYEYYGNIPRKRWIITKLGLLCAQEVGHALRPSSAFAALMFPSNALPAAAVGVAYSSSFNATGGIPFYDWEISAGTLPSGLTLDSFTGALTGTPTTSGVFNFTVHVRDYHEAGVGLTQAFALSVASPPSPRLALSIAVQGGSGEAHLFLFGSAGQKQIIQASGILSNWTPMATNLAGTKIFEFIESNPLEFPQRFYRAMVVP